ncbi:MAG: hypothetical protein IJ708_14360 [Clostridia bacterium]|nr:hypothetical protein [Clostridia bacterium]
MAYAAKKCWHFLILSVILASLSLSTCTAEGLRYSEVKQAIPDHWTATYQTKYREITIDTAILFPQVDTLPVLVLRPEVEAPVSQDANLVRNTQTPVYVYEYGSSEPMPDHVDSSYTVYTSPYRWDTPLSESNGITPRYLRDRLTDALDMLQLSPDTFDISEPRYITESKYTDTKSNKSLGSSYTLHLYQRLHGIDILKHAFSFLDSNAMQTGPTGDYYWECTSFFDLWAHDDFSLFLHLLTEEETLLEDIPVCAFSKVQQSIENEIRAGHIRMIHEIRLGYALYNPPGQHKQKDIPWRQTARFYAVPVWYVPCEYKKIGKEPLSSTEEDRLAWNTEDTTTLCFNAQTGELMNVWKSKKKKDAAAYPGVITWDDIR